jgi:hypothetical protein
VALIFVLEDGRTGEAVRRFLQRTRRKKPFVAMGMLVAPFFFYVLAIAFLGGFCSRGLESVQAGEAGFDVRQHLSSSTR